jgi:hypothetical protein
MLESEGKPDQRATSAPRNYIHKNAQQASLTYLKLKCDRSKYNQYFPERAAEPTTVLNTSLNSKNETLEPLNSDKKKRSNELLLKLSEKISQKKGGDQILWRAFNEFGCGKIASIATSNELKSILSTFHIVPNQEEAENLVRFLKEGLTDGRITLQYFRLKLEQSHIQ